MREYKLPCLDSVDWSKAQAQSIDECRWSPNKAPAATVQALFLEGKALIFRLESFAAPSRAVNYEPDSPVWQDSCLECFISFDGKNYVNLEANSNGALLACCGSGRHGRARLKDAGIVRPEVEAKVSESGWTATFTVPLDTVKAVWGVDVKRGGKFAANFYSCGDETPSPHYASWNPVETEKPDFHRPEYFGSLEII